MTARRSARPSSIGRARCRTASRPFAAFAVPEEVLEAWGPAHRTVQFALAIVAATDARMRSASIWPSEQPAELRMTPGLVFAAEGGVAIHVIHRLRPSQAFGEGASWFDHRATHTDFRLIPFRVVAKDGDWRTWHRTAFRMAELVEEYAAAYASAEGRTAEERARVAGRALSGRDARSYRRLERALETRFGSADCLTSLLGARC